MGRLLGVIWGEGISVNTLLVYSQENILTTHVHHYYIQNQRTENENSKIKDYKVKKKKETCIEPLTIDAWQCFLSDIRDCIKE